MALYPLVGRDCNDVLFRTTTAKITAGKFISAAQKLIKISSLTRGPVINLCRDRLNFAVTFAGCVLAGRPCLLTSDQRPSRLKQIATMFPTCSVITDFPKIRECPVPATTFEADFSAAPISNSPFIHSSITAAIVFTSGTTGEPRAYLKTWGELVARSHAAAQRFGFKKRTASLLATVPPYHMYGFETSILLPFHAPATTCCSSAFFNADVAEILPILDVPRVLITTPFQLKILRKIQSLSPDFVISATAELSPSLAQEIEHDWSTIVYEIYGATECGSIASRRTVVDDKWSLYPGVRLVKTPVGTELIGSYSRGTLLDDCLQLEGSTHFRLRGRQSDTIKLAGNRASLLALNEIFNNIDGIEDGLVCLSQNSREGSEPRLMAYVVAPTLTDSQIIHELRKYVQEIFLPRRIVRLTALPRNDVGKISCEDVACL